MFYTYCIYVNLTEIMTNIRMKTFFIVVLVFCQVNNLWAGVSIYFPEGLGDCGLETFRSEGRLFKAGSSIDPDVEGVDPWSIFFHPPDYSSLKFDDKELFELLDAIGVHVPREIFQNNREGFWDYLVPYENRAHVNMSALLFEKSVQIPRVRIIFLDQTPYVLIVEGLNDDQVSQEIKTSMVSGAKLDKNNSSVGYSINPSLSEADDNIRALSMWYGSQYMRFSGQNFLPCAPLNLISTRSEELQQNIIIAHDNHLPMTLSSMIFFDGMRAKENTRVRILGTGLGIDSIVLANQAKGNIEIIASDIMHSAVNLARFNAARSKYPDAINIYQGDLFDIEGRPSNEKYSSIQFNIPVEFGQTGDITKCDPGMQLLDRFLNEAGDHLLEGGVLEVTYDLCARFLEKVYSTGWEIVLATGLDKYTAERQADPCMYGRFILIPQKVNHDAKDIGNYLATAKIFADFERQHLADKQVNLAPFLRTYGYILDYLDDNSFREWLLKAHLLYMFRVNTILDKPYYVNTDYAKDWQGVIDMIPIVKEIANSSIALNKPIVKGGISYFNKNFIENRGDNKIQSLDDKTSYAYDFDTLTFSITYLSLITNFEDEYL